MSEGRHPSVDHLDLPEECPECGRECQKNRAFVSHYSQAHDPPYPWVDRTQRGHEWPAARREALERDGHTCQECGSTSDLHVHHINGDGNDHRVENLRTLCRDCHRERHGTAPRSRA